jgi:hypothetical protein
MSDPEPKPERRTARGMLIVKILTVTVFVVGLASLAIPGWHSSQRASNERQASSAMKTLCSAEADFRANDRDGNGVLDFWTADVKGLYTMTSAAERGASPSHAIKLIDVSVAAADADGAFVAAGGENVPLSAFTRSKARDGYWFLTMLTDQNEGDTREMTYRMDTKGTPPMGPVHHLSKFAFLAFPDSSSTGKYVFVTNENNTIFRQVPLADAGAGKMIPPGRKGVDRIWQHWPPDDLLKRLFHSKDCCPEVMPSEEELKSYRAKFD